VRDLVLEIAHEEKARRIRGRLPVPRFERGDRAVEAGVSRALRGGHELEHQRLPALVEERLDIQLYREKVRLVDVALELFEAFADLIRADGREGVAVAE